MAFRCRLSTRVGVRLGSAWRFIAAAVICIAPDCREQKLQVTAVSHKMLRLSSYGLKGLVGELSEVLVEISVRRSSANAMAASLRSARARQLLFTAG